MTRCAPAALVLALAGSGSALALAAPAAAAAPAELTCGATLSGPVRLSHDLHCPAGGVTLTGDATLDLRGHTFSGPGRATGVTVVGVGAFQVRNGRLSGWGTGIGPGPADQDDPDETDGSLAVDRVAFTGNQTGLDASGPQIGSVQARDVTVQRSSFTGNSTGVVTVAGRVSVRHSVLSDNISGAEAITGSLDVATSTVARNRIGLRCDESGCTFDRNVVAGNEAGISSTFFGATVTRNTFTGNTTAYDSSNDFGGARVEDNQFRANTAAISLSGGSGIIVARNTFTRNDSGITSADPGPDEGTQAVITGNRLTRNGDAIDLLTRVELGDNTANRNTGWGIHAPNAVDLGGNRAAGNGTSPQCTGVVCG